MTSLSYTTRRGQIETCIDRTALEARPLFALGAAGIGFGAGLFGHGTLTAAISMVRRGEAGFALGAWRAAPVTSAGLAIAFGGITKDVVSSLAHQGALGPVMNTPASGYMAV